MLTEQSTANIEKTKNIMNEIVDDLGRYLNVYKSHTVFLRGRIRRDKQEEEILLQTATSTLNEMKDKNEKLIDERNELRSRIGQDSLDLKGSEDEKQELMNQIRELEAHNSSLREILKEKKSMLGSLVKKVDLISEKNRQKEAVTDAKTSCFKKYLGMSIVPVKENVIRVVFNRMCSDDSVECFITLDLSIDAPVVDLFPRIYNLEKLNFLFREHSNFHEFLKVIRNEIKKEYSRGQ